MLNLELQLDMCPDFFNFVVCVQVSQLVLESGRSTVEPTGRTLNLETHYNRTALRPTIEKRLLQALAWASGWCLGR